ncbi:hypothetical protein PoB_002751900 [Plakobranchus ocellatus]|uniref:Uncharacterized protein n=1 Tax=Plakobranchus ocellatus TaxID=259542 RepID=A0AAV4A308_9GAST|nr:hypothetical protein PoB_002751900 [Plakobranchus ocellatus]
MAYIDAINLHTLPVSHEVKGREPAAILFPHGPRWSWRYHRNSVAERLDNRFMYKDQGPPMYQMRGAHFNMYATPPRTDHHDFCRSFHYEPRQYNAPSYRNGALTFPPGPPPAQVARFDAVLPPLSREPQVQLLHIPNRLDLPSIKSWDKYRYLPGPPTDTAMYGCPQAWETGKFA